MAIDAKAVEMERIRAMLEQFGWTLKTNSTVGDKVSMTFEKVLPVGSESQGKFESDRVVNLVKSFGWNALGAQFGGNVITTNFEKIINPV